MTTEASVLQRWEPTEVFESFWFFAAERQRMYRKRLQDAPGPWTADAVLSRYRFTNVYRASDRVSQYLLSNVIYDGRARTAIDDALRILLFKIFNKVETWQLLNRELGELTVNTFSAPEAGAVLDDAMRSGIRVYSAAYIVPPIPGSEGRKHHGHLQLLEDRLHGGGLSGLLTQQSLGDLVRELRSWPGIGPFLSYQFAIDLNYSRHLDFDEDDYVVAGPGARDGLSKCFAGHRAVEPEQLIRAVAAQQDEAFATRGLHFEGLWGRPLKLIDVQNVFCEISKYARAAHPKVQGTAGRERIKQRFLPAGALPAPVFPPRWLVRTDFGPSFTGETCRRTDEPGATTHGKPIGLEARGSTASAAMTTADQVRGVKSA
jgi:hypothetical protein